MDQYKKRPARQIRLIEKKALLVENTGVGVDFDFCTGETIGDKYVVTYGLDDSTARLKLHFPLAIKKYIDSLKNAWVDDPVINKSGLAAKLWPNDAEGNPNLRRRLESRAYRNTFKDEEKVAVLKIFMELINEIQESFDIEVK